MSPMNPGSHEAHRNFCRCSGPLNQYGRGMPGTSIWGAPIFVTHERCPQHGTGQEWAPVFVAVDRADQVGRSPIHRKGPRAP